MELNLQLAYEYARGYYDGRVKGFDNPPEMGTDSQLWAYRTGYDVGVTDYCELDENVTN